MAAPDSLALQDIHRVAVLGAGMMGPGIALQFARAGYDVTLWGLDPADVGRGQEAFERSLADLRARTILSARDARSARKHLRVETDLARAVADADFVSEAVPEVLELKQEIFERLDRETRPQAKHPYLPARESRPGTPADIGDSPVRAVRPCAAPCRRT